MKDVKVDKTKFDALLHKMLATPPMSYRFPLLTQLARETHNFRHRIRATLQTRLFERGVDLGPLCQKHADGSYRPCNETHARTEDTLRLCRERPWLTVLDSELFLEGWTMGAQFRAGTRAYCDIQQPTLTLPCPECRTLGHPKSSI